MDLGAGFRKTALAALAVSSFVTGGSAIAHAQAANAKPPNILVIMGDDVGWFNIGAYHRGIMSGKTPNLDKLAAAGHDVHRLLRRGKLHGGARQLHHRRAAHPHGFDDRRARREQTWECRRRP